ncbi:hypothetical protein RsS62_46280 [Rhizobium dioscoreae]|nr:hypothetical protein RsS62_46280 [Rhizobium dioscoreae]
MGSMNAQYMQVGNAVPVQLGTAIGNAIMRHHKSAKIEPIRHDADVMLSTAVARLRAAARNKVAKAA